MGHWCDTIQIGKTLQMVASREGRDGCVQLLLNKGAQIGIVGSAQCLFLSCYLV